MITTRENYIRNTLTESEAKTALIAIDKLIRERWEAHRLIPPGKVSDIIIGALELEKP